MPIIIIHEYYTMIFNLKIEENVLTEKKAALEMKSVLGVPQNKEMRVTLFIKETQLLF